MIKVYQTCYMKTKIIVYFSKLYQKKTFFNALEGRYARTALWQMWQQKNLMCVRTVPQTSKAKYYLKEIHMYLKQIELNENSQLSPVKYMCWKTFPL